MNGNILESLSDNIVIDKDKCIFCNICVETCVLDNLRMKLSPCRQACPLGVNCQGYVQLIARGEEEKGMEVLRETLPFPGILGRICSQPCEENCHRKKIEGEAVAIRALKRYLVDSTGSKKFEPSIAPETGRRVAIIGSGPAGLMASYDLRSRGHRVTIIEKEPEPGGMLRWAIPEYRLPRKVLEGEIELLRDMGIEFRCGIAIESASDIAKLKEDFQALIIATGCPHPITLHKSDHPPIQNALPFLRSVRSGEPSPVGSRTVIIGGGNSAVDTARTALRLGAEKVSIVCLESREEIPAFSWELEDALAEGIALECSWGAPKFISTSSGLKIEFSRCLAVFDSCGDFNPSYEPATKKQIEADTVIIAIGQRIDTALFEYAGLDPVKPATDTLTLQTADEMIFVAGDCGTGPSTAVEAMASGRRAAESVHRFLAGEHLRYGRAYAGPFELDFEIDTSRGAPHRRSALPRTLYREKNDFSEIEQGYDRETARREAERCYSCGQPYGRYRTCWFCLPCEVECPHDALWVEIPYLLR